MRTVPANPASMQVALATLVPFFVGVVTGWAAHVIGEGIGMDMAPFTLVGWCAVLFASAVWLNRVLFWGIRALIPFMAAIAAILAIWLWQRQAIISLVPGSELTYGYFLKPVGAEARFWVLTCPFWVGLTCLSACCIAALILGWRAGARRSLTCLVPWWLLAFLVFALPSMNLAVQGNATVFI